MRPLPGAVFSALGEFVVKPALSFMLCLGLLLGSLGVMVWTASSPGILAWTAQNPPGQAVTDLVLRLGDNPFNIEFDPVRVDVRSERLDRERYAGWIASPVKGVSDTNARSRKLHAARLLCLSGGSPEWLIRYEAPVVTRVNLPKQDFWRTWRGLEMAESDDGKQTEHRDQTLAALAELGVPLSATVDSEDGTFHVYDLLRTSLSEFHLDQKEISWTATAYACYLPPQTTWWNRYGEQFSLDRLAEEIMLRPLTRESCRGTHLVMALTKIARVDRELGILDPGVRARLVSYLRGKLTEAVSAQLDDGSWPLCWSPSGFAVRDAEFTPENTDINRIMVTGHLLEWFHLLPGDLKPPGRCVKAGTLWTQSKLRSSSKETISKAFCPYTHAVICLDLACSPTQ